MDSQFNFDQRTIRNKMDNNFSLISPPTTPPPPAPGRSSLSSSGSKRPRPYPAVSREPFYTMSNTPSYPSWSSSGRPHPVERKPTDGDKLAGYAAAPQFVSTIIKMYEIPYSFSLESKLYA
jgi:hypothetical protein